MCLSVLFASLVSFIEKQTNQSVLTSYFGSMALIYNRLLIWIYENAHLNGKLNDSLIIANPKYVQYVDNSTISGHWTCLMNNNNNYNVYHQYTNI